MQIRLSSTLTDLKTIQDEEVLEALVEDFNGVFAGTIGIVRGLTGDSGTPDGRRIAFVSNRDGRLEAHVMNADGSGQRNLAH